MAEMPWKESNRMDERVRFVLEVEKDERAFAEVCREFGISRTAGYRWVRRHEESGIEGLKEKSHAPVTRPQAMSERVREAILGLRGKRPTWGPKKLKAYLERRQMGQGKGKRETIPAASSIGELLKREGLISRRKRGRERVLPSSEPLGHAEKPNDVWSIDYKGWFQTGNGLRCEPLTVTDNASRYLIRLTAMPGIEQERARLVLEAAFRELGLPGAIRSDNGSPFVTPAPGGLSKLSIWWQRLGVRHERIEPGAPQQNGRHERMHLSLKTDSLQYRVGWDYRAQQRIFNEYQRDFNEVRPHEALAMKVPGEVYQGSARSYPGRLPEMEYGRGFEARRVNEQGRFLWNGERVMLSEVLEGEMIGLRECDEDLYEVKYGTVLLGWLDGWAGVFVREERAVGWASSGKGAQTS